LGGDPYFWAKKRVRFVDYARNAVGNPRFWAKKRGAAIETCTNIQKFDQMLQNHRKDGGKGGQNVQKGGRKIYKKSWKPGKKG